MFLRVHNAFCLSSMKARYPSDLPRVSSLISVPGKLFLRVVGPYLGQRSLWSGWSCLDSWVTKAASSYFLYFLCAHVFVTCAELEQVGNPLLTRLQGLW